MTTQTATESYANAQTAYAEAQDRSPCHAEAWLTLLVAECVYKARIAALVQ